MIEYKVTVSKDCTVWRNLDGELHRKDGPAIEWKDGSIAWYQNDKLHRLDGPAIECKNGDKYWYQNNKFHRLDGPAIEYSDGRKGWWIEGIEYMDYQFNDYIKNLNRPCVGKKVIVDRVEYELK